MFLERQPTLLAVPDRNKLCTKLVMNSILVKSLLDMASVMEARAMLTNTIEILKISTEKNQLKFMNTSKKYL